MKDSTCMYLGFMALLIFNSLQLYAGLRDVDTKEDPRLHVRMLKILHKGL